MLQKETVFRIIAEVEWTVLSLLDVKDDEEGTVDYISRFSNWISSDDVIRVENERMNDL